MTKIAASILSADFANLKHDCTRLLEAGVDLMHFDVMDGHFVPNISYGAPVLKCLHAAMPYVYYDVHLMISDPARYAADFARQEPASSPSTSKLCRTRQRRSSPLSALRAARSASASAPAHRWKLFSRIWRCRSDPGHERGARFRRAEVPPHHPHAALAAICAERTRRGCDTLIEVDGGINTETGPLCIAAGVDWLVAGSSLFHAMDPAAVVNVLHSK